MKSRTQLGRPRREEYEQTFFQQSDVKYADSTCSVVLGGVPSARRGDLHQRISSLATMHHHHHQQQQHQHQHQQQAPLRTTSLLQHKENKNNDNNIAPATTAASLTTTSRSSIATSGVPHPPDEGRSRVSASTQATQVTIEQLFEDDAYFKALAPRESSTDPIKADCRAAETKPHLASRSLQAHRRLSKTSAAHGLNSLSSSLHASLPAKLASLTSSASSSSVDPPSRKKSSSSIPSLNASSFSSRTSLSSQGHRSSMSDAMRQLTSRSSRRLGFAAINPHGGGGGGNGSGGFTPLPGAHALKEFPSHLTELEKAEIKQFKTVYYLGQMAAKLAAQEDGEKNDSYDDKDGFYVCKPKDHLLYRYEIMEILGKGTFGQVVKAFDHKNSSLVAMKIVKNEKPFLRQAKEEVRILEVLRRQDKMDSFNLVHILDNFKWRGHVCISFELLGLSLHQLLRKSRGQGFSANRVQKLVRGILHCLEVLAKNRIIHCDIKPENILLRRTAAGVSATSGNSFSDFSLKVIDFGSSCYEQQQIYTYIQSRYYRAPEVIMGMRYTCAIDMWSLACVAGELYTARPLFAGEDEHDQLASYMEVCGVPSAAQIQRSKRAEKFFFGEEPRYLNRTTKRQRAQPKTVTLSSLLKDTEDKHFLDFMERVLVLDPAKRLTPSDALLHPWLLRGQASKASSGDSKPAMRSASVDIQKLKRMFQEKAQVGHAHASCAKTSVSASNTGTKLLAPAGSSSNNNSCLSGAKLPPTFPNTSSEAKLLLARARSGTSLTLPSWDSR